MNKKFDFELKKIWQWLFYMYIVLPVVLFALAFLCKGISLGIPLARLYHSYCMYIVNPVPDIPSFTGIFGAVLALVAVFKTLYKKDIKDFAVSMTLIAINFVYYYSATNYLLIKYLNFG